MSKIQKISVSNLKAISELEIDFKGCTAIITGGNDKGKSTFLRGIIDRVRGVKPEMVVKNGKKEGNGTITLTTGEKFIWEFDIEGEDKLTFLTKEGYKTKVSKEIIARFFPPSFDIDKFLNSQPKEQSKQLQKIVGIDFSEIDSRYNLAYDDRTEKNREAERFQVKLSKMLECEKVEPVDLTELQKQKEAERVRLNALYKKNKEANDLLRDAWNKEKEKINKEVSDFNTLQADNRVVYNKCFDLMNALKAEGFESLDLNTFVKAKGQAIKKDKVSSDLYPIEPEYCEEMPDDKDLQAIDKKILDASETNTKAKAYTDYIAYKASTENAAIEAKDADIKVKAIEAERESLIKSANMPTGISFAAEGITVDGFPLDKSQISSSKLYCAALRIASMNMGEVKALHFDASFLDKNTLAEIEQWANENNLQLLIERADFDAGDIRYELIENK
jgi:biopolymer transport protein ExbD